MKVHFIYIFIQDSILSFKNKYQFKNKSEIKLSLFTKYYTPKQLTIYNNANIYIICPINQTLLQLLPNPHTCNIFPTIKTFHCNTFKPLADSLIFRRYLLNLSFLPLRFNLSLPSVNPIPASP